MNAQNEEVSTESSNSLSMFFAAIGGAVLGMLATLLILAIINGGTLYYGSSRWDNLQNSRIDTQNEQIMNLIEQNNLQSQQIMYLQERVLGVKYEQ